MKILDMLKRFIGINKVPLLPELEDEDRTQEIVPIIVIESLIYNEEEFNKFISNNKRNMNKKEYIAMVDCAMEVKEYADFMQSKGIKFSKEEKI